MGGYSDLSFVTPVRHYNDYFHGFLARKMNFEEITPFWVIFCVFWDGFQGIFGIFCPAGNCNIL